MISSDMPEVSAKLDEVVEQFQLTAIRDRVVAAAEPAVVGASLHDSYYVEDHFDRLQKKSGEAARFQTYSEWMNHLIATTPLGATQASGLPDLPPNFDRPRSNGQYIPFVAQIDLAAVPRLSAFPLPASGWLYFFASTDLQCPPIVRHFDCARAELVRYRRPTDFEILTDWCGNGVYFPIPTRPLTIYPSLPDYFGDWWKREKTDDSNYGPQLFDLKFELDDPFSGEQTIRIGGYPTHESIKYLTENILPKVETTFWQLLLEIPSIGNMLWSDAGVFDFYIRRDDLERGDFSRVVAEISSP